MKGYGKLNVKGTILSMIIVALAIAIVGGVGLILTTSEENNYFYENEQANVAITVVEKEVENYIERYFASNSIENIISEDDMALIVKHVSDGILEEYAEDDLSYDEELIIKEMIATAVTKASDVSDLKAELAALKNTYSQSNNSNDTTIKNILSRLDKVEADVKDLIETNMESYYNAMMAEYLPQTTAQPVRQIARP